MRVEWLLWLLAGAGLASGAELLDRMAATVGDYAITSSAVFRQLRLEAFLDGRTPDFSPASRRQAAERLGEQQLVRREMELTRHDLYVADECFFTGTAAEVIPVTQIDGRPIGTGKPGPLTKRLQRQFFDIVHGNDERFKEWLTYL